MIVTSNPNNSDKYLELFTEAYEYLHELGGYVDDKESGRFESLAEYYSHMADFFVNKKYKFIMLPVDEEALEIDLDTRTINVPDSFAKCASVQSDHLAEMVIFTADRYYDYMDLANTQIFVQWTIPENKTLGIEEVKGATRVEMIDLETEPGKLRFAWPLNDKITQTAGNVKFAVRFFTLDPKDLTIITYSLNTTEAVIAIKAALQTSLNEDAEIESPLADSSFKKVIINSSFPGEGQLPPAEPAFTEPGSDIDGEGMFVVDGQKVFNLEDDAGALRVQAWSPDAGEYRYVWYYKNNKPNAGWYNCAEYPQLDENNRPLMTEDGEYESTTVWATPKDEYVEVTPTERVKHERYYQLVNGSYKLYTGNIPAEVKLYERYNVLELPKSGEVTGYYKACVYNSVNDLVTRIPVFSSTCMLPGPQKIVFKENGNLPKGAILADDSFINLAVDIEEDIYNPKTTYIWRKSQAAKDEVLDTVTSAWQTLAENDVNVTEPGWYSVQVKSELNREETNTFSSVCKVTNMPEPPVVESKGSMVVLHNITAGNPQTLTVEADIVNEDDWGRELLTEKFEYIWQIKLMNAMDSAYMTLTEDNVSGVEGLGTKSLTIDNTLTFEGKAQYFATLRCLVVNVLNGETAIFDHSGEGNFEGFVDEAPYIYEDPTDNFAFMVAIK